MNSSHELDRSFLALSHPARRTIVERLAEGPATVGEASKGLGLSKPAVSKHVRVLEDAGLIRRIIEGREHRLRLEGRSMTEAEAGSSVSEAIDQISRYGEMEEVILCGQMSSFQT